MTIKVTAYPNSTMNVESTGFISEQVNEKTFTDCDYRIMAGKMVLFFSDGKSVIPLKEIYTIESI